MRGDVVYRVYGQHEGREKDSFFGAFRTRVEAEQEVAKFRAKEMNGKSWAGQYHDRGFAIREARVETDFELPSRPKPRERYLVRTVPHPNASGWDSTKVEVLQRAVGGEAPGKLFEYVRNHGMFQTFEPFRQGDRELALISREYTKTAVLDLATGEVIAEETDTLYRDGSSGAGFCPVGFYVPDWWDLHDGSVIPGSEYWTPDSEWPTGDFGFVWGCQWGDDSSWKVQYLDLSRVRQGVLVREERFGYLELATHDYLSPVFRAELPDAASKPPFIQVSRHSGKLKTVFAIEMQFDLVTGKPVDWERRGIANLE
jgi:hypothetical protein